MAPMAVCENVVTAVAGPTHPAAAGGGRKSDGEEEKEQPVGGLASLLLHCIPLFEPLDASSSSTRRIWIAHALSSPSSADGGQNGRRCGRKRQETPLASFPPASADCAQFFLSLPPFAFLSLSFTRVAGMSGRDATRSAYAAA